MSKVMLALLVVLSTAVSSQAVCSTVGSYTKAWKKGYMDTEEKCQQACVDDAKCAHYSYNKGCATLSPCTKCWLSGCDGVAEDNGNANVVKGPAVCDQDKCVTVPPKKPEPPTTVTEVVAVTTAAGSSGGSLDSSSIPWWGLLILAILLCCCCCLLPLLGMALGLPFCWPKKTKKKKVIKPSAPLPAPEPVMFVAPPVVAAAQPVQTMSMVARPVQTTSMVAQPVTYAAPPVSSFTTTAVAAPTGYSTGGYPAGGYAVVAPATGYSTGGYSTGGYPAGGYSTGGYTLQ